MRPYAPPRYKARLGQDFAGYFGWPPASGDAIRLFFHASTAALGLVAYFRLKGFWKWAGLVLGTAQAIGGICDAMSLAERVFGAHAPEKMGCALHEDEEEGLEIGCSKCKKKKKRGWTLEEQSTPEMGCAPCKARLLQEEANEEFKRRYGLIDTNRMMGAPAWGQGVASGIPVYNSHNAPDREMMLKRLPVPGHVTVQYPYMIKVTDEGEYWVSADGSTQFYSYRTGTWQSPERTSENDLLWNTFNP